MSHYFYKYEVYQKEGIDYTLLKWFVDGDFMQTQKIDKPTLDLTQDDLNIIQHFINEGSVVQDKIDIPIPPDLPDLGI